MVDGKGVVINMPFYKTVVTVEILSEREISVNSLHDIADQIETGDWSGAWDISSVEILSPKQMAKALIDQGSDPYFFGLDTPAPIE